MISTKPIYGILDVVYKTGDKVIVKIWHKKANHIVVYYHEGIVIGMNPNMNYIVSVKSNVIEVTVDNLVKYR